MTAVRPLSIPRNERVDIGAPGVDSTLHAGDRGKAAFPKPSGDPQAADTVMAVHEDPTGTPGLDLTDAFGKFLHRQEHRAGDARRGVLLGRATVEQEAFAGVRLREESADFGGRKFEGLFIHGKIGRAHV